MGGHDVEDDSQAPFICSLQFRLRHICGCAIITSEWSLNALIFHTSETNECIVNRRSQAKSHEVTVIAGVAAESSIIPVTELKVLKRIFTLLPVDTV